MGHRCTEHGVPRILLVGRGTAPPDVEVSRNMSRQQDARAAAHALKEVSIQQSGAHKHTVVGRNIPEVGVLKLELYTWVCLNAKRKQTLAHAEIYRRRTRICRRPIYL